MKSKLFENAVFHYGWEVVDTITFLGKEYNITISAKAYFKSEGITVQQETAYLEFKNNKEQILKKIEKALQSENAEKYIPKFLSIQKNGDTALFFDDACDVEDGIVVCITPEIKLMDIDEYL